MSTNANDPRRAGRTDRGEGARQVLEADKRRRRRMIAIQVGVVALVVAAVIGGTVYALSGSDDNAAVAGSVPAGVNDDGAYLVGNPEAPVTIQVVEDFQCPVCQQFEAVAGAMLDEYAAGDDVNVEYRGIAFLDRASTTDYSSRALNASACVIDSSSAETWKEFHRQLYVEQPPEGGAGLPDSDLVRIAQDAGAGDVELCVADRTWDDWVQATTAAAFDDGVDGTPTVFVNGEEIADFDPATIQAAVDEALAS
ncbi:MAG: DsbA family protein [Nocardioides sp.]